MADIYYAHKARHLAFGTTQHFKLKVPNAQRLVVMIGFKKFPLKKRRLFTFQIYFAKAFVAKF